MEPSSPYSFLNTVHFNQVESLEKVFNQLIDDSIVKENQEYYLTIKNQKIILTTDKSQATAFKALKSYTDDLHSALLKYEQNKDIPYVFCFIDATCAFQARAFGKTREMSIYLRAIEKANQKCKGDMRDNFDYFMEYLSQSLLDDDIDDDLFNPNPGVLDEIGSFTSQNNVLEHQLLTTNLIKQAWDEFQDSIKDRIEKCFEKKQSTHELLKIFNFQPDWFLNEIFFELVLNLSHLQLLVLAAMPEIFKNQKQFDALLQMKEENLKILNKLLQMMKTYGKDDADFDIWKSLISLIFERIDLPTTCTKWRVTFDPQVNVSDQEKRRHVIPLNMNDRAMNKGSIKRRSNTKGVDGPDFSHSFYIPSVEKKDRTQYELTLAERFGEKFKRKFKMTRSLEFEYKMAFNEEYTFFRNQTSSKQETPIKSYDAESINDKKTWSKVDFFSVVSLTSSFDYLVDLATTIVEETLDNIAKDALVDHSQNEICEVLKAKFEIILKTPRLSKEYNKLEHRCALPKIFTLRSLEWFNDTVNEFSAEINQHFNKLTEKNRSD